MRPKHQPYYDFRKSNSDLRSCAVSQREWKHGKCDSFMFNGRLFQEKKKDNTKGSRSNFDKYILWGNLSVNVFNCKSAGIISQNKT